MNAASSSSSSSSSGEPPNEQASAGTAGAQAHSGAGGGGAVPPSARAPPTVLTTPASDSSAPAITLDAPTPAPDQKHELSPAKGAWAADGIPLEDLSARNLEQEQLRMLALPPDTRQPGPVPNGGLDRAAAEADRPAPKPLAKPAKLSRELFMQFGEILLYFVFVVIFCFAAYGTRDPQYSFYMNQLTKELILNEPFPFSQSPAPKTFYGVSRIEDFWVFLGYPVGGPFIDGITMNNGLVYGVNRLLGVARMRQLRVRSNSCKVVKTMRPLFGTIGCIAPYSLDDQEKATFGNASNPAFVWRSAGSLDAQRVLGRINSYSGGGYVFDFSGNYAADMAGLTALYNGNWVDVQTRLVVIDFTTYNANLNMFFTGQLVFEFLPSGGILPSSTFRVMRLYRYADSAAGRVQLFLEISVLLFVLGYTLQESWEMYKDIGLFLRDGWNFFDVSNLLLFYALFIMRAIISVEFAKFKDPTKFFNFSNLVLLTSAEYNLVSFNGFLIFFKVLKYTRFSKQAIIITKTIKRGIIAIGTFTTMVLFILIGFAFFANQSFGIDVSSYRTFGFSIFSMFRGVLGDLDFDTLWDNNRFMGPLFFISFVVLFVFILLNMFLAIIDEAYTHVTSKYAHVETKETLAFRSLRTYAASKLPPRVQAMREAARRRKEARQTQMRAAKADRNADMHVDRREAEALFVSGHHMDSMLGVSNVDEFFDVYDANGDGVLDQAEQERVMRHLEAERAHYDSLVADLHASERASLTGDAAVPGVSAARVANLERVVLSLHGKLDVALEFLTAVNSQLKRDRVRRGSVVGLGRRGSVDLAAARRRGSVDLPGGGTSPRNESAHGSRDNL